MPCVQDRLGAGPDRAGEGEGRAAQRAGQPGDADGRLAEGALAVDGPFAGQAEVGPAEPFAQVDGLDDEVDPRLEPARGEGDQPAAQSPRRARAGEVADRDAQVALDDRGEVGEVAVERLRPSPASAPFCGP